MSDYQQSVSNLLYLRITTQTTDNSLNTVEETNTNGVGEKESEEEEDKEEETEVETKEEEESTGTTKE